MTAGGLNTNEHGLVPAEKRTGADYTNGVPVEKRAGANYTDGSLSKNEQAQIDTDYEGTSRV